MPQPLRGTSAAHRPPEGSYRLMPMTEQAPEPNMSDQTPGPVTSDEETVGVPVPVRSGPRPHREPLVPLWVYGVVAALVAVVAIVAGTQFALHGSVTAAVPDVRGLDIGVARTRLIRAGFEFGEGDRRFSPRPRGEVLSQVPAPGRVVRRGSVVNVIASAGTERFALPDVIGDGITLARGTLESQGLEVKIASEASTMTKDTVLATNPSPGALVQTGDVVIVTVASTNTLEGTLQPYRFNNTLIVIDPSKATTQGTDITLEVARRLRSLLEASGSAVLVTRSLSDRDVSVEARARRAAGAKATAVLGLDVLAKGPPGFAVGTPSALSAAQIPATTELANTLAQALTIEGKAPDRLTYPSDAFTSTLKAPMARVTLGSLADRGDAASLKDPQWADSTARLLYRALGDQYGSR